MESINLIEAIENTHVLEGGSKSDIFTENVEGQSYARYLELLDSYYKQSTKGKFNTNYDFFVDDDGNYVKNALDKKDEKNNMVVLKPKYINIKTRLDELTGIIKGKESMLRYFRTQLLNNNNAVKSDFDSTLEDYNKLLAERDSINNYNNKTNKISENKDTITKLKLDNININLEQYNTMNSIKLREANEDEVIHKYLLNNEAINSNNDKIIALTSQPVNEFIVKEVFNNNTPVKKTIKFKITKKSTKSKKSAKDADASESKALVPESKDADESKELVPDPETNDELDEVDLSNPDKDADKGKAESKELVPDPETNDELEEVDLSKPGKDADKAESKGKELVPDPETNDELEEVDLGLKAEELDLGDDLEALQPLFDDGDEDNSEYVFNKSETSNADVDEDKNIPLKFDSDGDGDGDGDGESSNEPKGKEPSMNVEGDGDGESSNAPKDKGKAKAKDKGKEPSMNIDGDELDLDKLSKQLNKQVKDPNIKIIRVDPNLQFSNITSLKCDDSKTKRSNIETTNVAGGKIRKKKGIDPELKNCIFPFKEGKGKKAVMNTECSDTGIEDWCATERKEDCSAEKWAYCKSEK